MITDLTVLFAGFVIVMFLIGCLRESTVMFGIGAGFSFIMCVMVRLVTVPYAFINKTNVVVTGSFTLDDLSATILFFVIGMMNVVLYFVFRLQHSAEDTQQKQKEI